MVEPQPTKIPIWNTSGTNRTEPLSTEKTSGWTINDQPPSSYFNWLQYYTGAWFTWLSERIYKGSAEIDLTISALQPDTAGDGGDLTLSSGEANGANASGDVTIGSPDSSVGDTGNVSIKAGDVSSSGPGAGGDLSLEAGNGWSDDGGDVHVYAGNAGGTGANDAGEVIISGGAGGAGTGGRIVIAAGSALLTGGIAGDVEIAGATGYNQGSNVEITAGNAATGPAGDVSITAGRATSSGSGGDVDITAGQSPSGVEGGDVNITGGTTSNSNGGDVNITGGSPTGTDRQAGFVVISSGSSTGAGGGKVALSVAEAGTSGSITRVPVEYIDCNGGSTAKRIALNKHTIISSAGDTARGNLQLVSRSLPTAPNEGDLYADSASHQASFFDGTRYHNLNPLVYNLNTEDKRGQNPPAVTSGVVVYQELPYPFTTLSSTPVKHTIPANSLRVGSQIRVLYFVNNGAEADLATRLYLGSIGSGPPYTSPGGHLLQTSNSFTWRSVLVDVRYVVSAIGASGVMHEMDRQLYYTGGQIDLGAGARFSLDTSQDVDVFVALVFSTPGAATTFLHFLSVEVI